MPKPRPTRDPDRLAVDGGQPAIAQWPPRRLLGAAEKQAAMRLFDRAIASGEAFGYNGPEERAYCEEFAAFMGGGFADAVNSGTSAVYVALRAVSVPAFSEVICGPISDPGGTMPIALAGCIPVPADAEPGQFSMSPASVAARLSERTGAIVVTHVAGHPADLGPILDLARPRGIPVIEDCAQSHGARYRGQLVGTLGAVAAFSTMFGKHHVTGGQGGVVFTRDEGTYWRARRHSDRGKPFNLPGARGNVVAALNLNLNDLGGAIGRVQLRRLPRLLAARQASARWFVEACRRELAAVRVLPEPPGCESAFWFLLMQLDLARLRVDKATFVKALAAEGVPCAASYLHLFVDHDWYRNRAVLEGSRFPWDSPHYRGDPDREYPVPTIRDTDRYTFQLPWHEKLDIAFAERLLGAFRKVERAYLA